MNAITLIEIALLLVRSYPDLFEKTPLRILLPLALSPSVSRLRISTPFLLGSLLTYTATALRLLCYHTLGRHFTPSENTFLLQLLPSRVSYSSRPIYRHLV